MKPKATKEQVLEFIKKREMVYIYDLVERFGYFYDGAQIGLNRLKKQYLVTGMGWGWVLTETAYRG